MRATINVVEQQKNLSAAISRWILSDHILCRGISLLACFLPSSMLMHISSVT
jgi:hypothetical protein